MLSAFGNVILWLAACGNTAPHPGILYLGIQNAWQTFSNETVQCSHGIVKVCINRESDEKHSNVQGSRSEPVPAPGVGPWTLSRGVTELPGVCPAPRGLGVQERRTMC